MARPVNTWDRVRGRLDAMRNASPGECWEWTGERLHFGHGRVRCDGRQWRVHRLAYAKWVGPIAPGLDVCHHCDNPACFNPAHLFLGSRSDNRRDCVAKARHARGEAVSSAVLTEPDVVQIRRDPASARALARRYGVAATTIDRARNGRTWRHVPGQNGEL